MSTDPDLGMDAEKLSELAAIDWHAGHPEQAHLGRRCVCLAPATRGEFAIRLLTGQAQLSTDRHGNAWVATVQEVDPGAGRPQPLRLLAASAKPEELGRPLVAFTVYGVAETDGSDHDPDCHHPECGGSVSFLSEHASLAVAPGMEAATALHMTFTTLREFGIGLAAAEMHRQRHHDQHDQCDGQHDERGR